MKKKRGKWDGNRQRKKGFETGSGKKGFWKRKGGLGNGFEM